MKPRLLVGLCGKKRCGKSTAAETLVMRHGFTQMAVADPLKEATRALFGFSPDQLEDGIKDSVDQRWGVSPRRCLQVIGTDLIRDQLGSMLNLKENIFVTRLRQRINQTPGNVVISDIRFPDEMALIKELGGFILRIERDLDPTVSDSHISEMAIDDAEPDYVIDNRGFLGQLESQLSEALIFMKYHSS